MKFTTQVFLSETSKDLGFGGEGGEREERTQTQTQKDVKTRQKATHIKRNYESILK